MSTEVKELADCNSTRSQYECSPPVAQDHVDHALLSQLVALAYSFVQPLWRQYRVPALRPNPTGAGTIGACRVQGFAVHRAARALCLSLSFLPRLLLVPRHFAAVLRPRAKEFHLRVSSFPAPPVAAAPEAPAAAPPVAASLFLHHHEQVQVGSSCSPCHSCSCSCGPSRKASYVMWGSLSQSFIGGGPTTSRRGARAAKTCLFCCERLVQPRKSGPVRLRSCLIYLHCSQCQSSRSFFTAHRARSTRTRSFGGVVVARASSVYSTEVAELAFVRIDEIQLLRRQFFPALLPGNFAALLVLQKGLEGVLNLRKNGPLVLLAVSIRSEGLDDSAGELFRGTEIHRNVQQDHEALRGL
mmetsp:Transcript_26018/g.65567  ORF Transcript_26018/g.65567 Transcript_26018/m.65567 type:complete len:356 (+) Transcript_26018:559-1626(+)